MDQQCAVCHKKSDQLLMLSCGHDPCIDCAATHYFAGAQFRRQFQLMKQANYWCQVCFQPTTIDKSSISQLNLYLSKKYKESSLLRQTLQKSKSPRVRNYSKNQRTSSHSPTHAFHRYSKAKQKIKQSNAELDKLIQLASSQQMLKSNYNIAHSQYSNQLRSSLKGVKSANQLFTASKIKPSLCHKHEDEVRNYYCFTCVKSICVECALHGSHVGHQVEAFKKASARLKVIYQNLINESENYKTTLQSNVKDIDRIIQNFKSWNEQHVLLIKQKFKQLLKLLSLRQEKLLNEIRQQEVDGIYKLNIIKRKHQQVLTEIKASRKNLKKSLALEPVQWNAQQLQGAKNQLKNLISNHQLELGHHRKLENQVQYVETQIVMQAIDTIEQLVSSFKIVLKSGHPLKKS